MTAPSSVPSVLLLLGMSHAKQVVTTPCVSVSGAGLPAANGLYAQQPLHDYVGPLAYHQPATQYWLFRWHQTWWHIAKLDRPLDSDASFTDAVIYTAIVDGDDSDHPPTSGWTGDVMKNWGPVPPPRISKLGVCFIDSHEVGGGLTWLGDSTLASSPDDDLPIDANARKTEHGAASTAARFRMYTVWRPAARQSLEALALVLLIVAYCRCVCCGRWGAGRKRTRPKVVVFCPQEELLHGRLMIQTAKPLSSTATDAEEVGV